MQDDPTKSNFGLDEHYRLIGSVASGWSKLELHVNRLIWDMADIQHMPGACLTSQIFTLYARMQALQALIDLRLGDKNKFVGKLSTFTKKARGCQDKRNRMIHDFMARNLETKEHEAFRAIIIGDKLDFGGTPITTDEIKEFIAKLKDLIRDWKTLEKEIRAAVDALPSQQKWQRSLYNMKLG